MSLDDLARASGVSRAALSQIETCKSNPTVGVLWRIAVGLGVPFAELVGAPRSGVMVLKRSDAQVLRSSDGRLESRPLTPAGASPLVELYELRLSARSSHSSEAHAPGTHELLVVLSGQLKMHVADEVYDLAAGDSIAFAADRPHPSARITSPAPLLDGKAPVPTVQAFVAMKSRDGLSKLSDVS